MCVVKQKKYLPAAFIVYREFYVKWKMTGSGLHIWQKTFYLDFFFSLHTYAATCLIYAIMQAWSHSYKKQNNSPLWLSLDTRWFFL